MFRGMRVRQKAEYGGPPFAEVLLAMARMSPESIGGTPRLLMCSALRSLSTEGRTYGHAGGGRRLTTAIPVPSPRQRIDFLMRVRV